MNYQRYCSSCGAPHNNMAFKCSICQQTEAILSAQKQAEKERAHEAAAQRHQEQEEYYRNRYPSNGVYSAKEQTIAEKVFFGILDFCFWIFMIGCGVFGFTVFYWMYTIFASIK